METISNFFGVESPLFALSNLKKSWRTTVIGAIIIVCALTSVFLPITAQYATWNIVVFPILIGLSLCFSSPKTDEKITK